MMSGARTVVGVFPAAAVAKHRRLLDALELAYALRFVGHQAGGESLDGALLLSSGGRPPSLEGSLARVPTLTLDGAQGLGAARQVDVRVAAHAGVDRRIRGIVLAAQAAGAPLQLAEELPLALGPEGPVWTRRKAARRIERVAAGLPVFEEGATLLDAIHGPCSLGLLALVEFLRALGSERGSQAGLRCALVFDDPNLRSRRYGFIDYKQLLEHADVHCYHAVMAMIPLDVECRSKAVVTMFRARSDRLSLAMHGNNHSSRELMRTGDYPSALSLGAQALRRIDRFEAHTQIRVARVMMPPHGGWSRTCARALGALGYDALCTTQHRPPGDIAPEGSALAGWTPARFVDGCAVVPRLPLTLDRTGIALRAFLGQPLVLYGHHGDLASGLEPLAAAASLVNSMGDVRWCSVGEILRSNYDSSVDHGTMIVRPWSGGMRITIPEGVEKLTVQEPDEGGTNAGLTGWSMSGASGPPRRFGEMVRAPGAEVAIRLRSAWATDPAMIASPGRSVAAVVRRRLSEARDQLAPVYRLRSSS